MRNNLRKLKSLSLTLDSGLEESRKLRKLAAELNDGCDELDALRLEARDLHSRVLNRVRLQGDALIKAKEMLGHGHFLPWLERSVERISTRTARNWMRAARWADANVQAFANLESVAQLYMLAGILPGATQVDVVTEPAFSLALAKRCLRGISRINLPAALALPPSERAELVEALAPAHAAYEALAGTLGPTPVRNLLTPQPAAK